MIMTMCGVHCKTARWIICSNTVCPQKELTQALAKAQQPSAREPIAQLNGNNTLAAAAGIPFASAHRPVYGPPGSGGADADAGAASVCVTAAAGGHGCGRLPHGEPAHAATVTKLFLCEHRQRDPVRPKKRRHLPCGAGNYVILFSFAGTFSEKAINSTVHGALSRISTCMANFLNLSVSFSIGELCR